MRGLGARPLTIHQPQFSTAAERHWLMKRAQHQGARDTRRSGAASQLPREPWQPPELHENSGEPGHSLSQLLLPRCALFRFEWPHGLDLVAVRNAGDLVGETLTLSVPEHRRNSTEGVFQSIEPFHFVP